MEEQLPQDQQQPRSSVEWQNWNEARLEDLASQVRMVANLASQVATHAYKIDQGHEDMLALREQLKMYEARLLKEINGVAEECKDFHLEYREDKKHTKEGNRAMVVAIILGSFTVLAAIISAGAVIVGGG